MDALEDNFDEFKETRPSLVLEVGSGSGCVITFLSALLKSIGPVFALATDINPHATRATQCTAMRNLVSVDSIMTSMCQGTRLDGKVDVLIFNPPYVPSEEIIHPSSTIVPDNIIDAAFAGGPDGRYWIDVFFPHVPRLLSSKGSFWLVTIEQNKPAELMKMAEKNWGLKSKVTKSRKAGFEMLYILKFWKSV